MKYFGVPTCPYCRKRVNLIRTWSLKRQGEYRCPRCSGISNIYLSPLIYVFALLAVFAGGAVYFFHKFVLDDISFSILVQVIVPFAVFFLLSLFMVYLEKPVIKKVPKAEVDKKRRREQFLEERRAQPSMQPIQYDSGEYLPRGDYAAGPLPEPPTKLAPQHSPTPRAVSAQDELSKTSVVRTAPQRQTPAPERPRMEPSRVERPMAARPQEVRPRAAQPRVEHSKAEPFKVERPVASHSQQVEVYTPSVRPPKEVPQEEQPKVTAARSTDDFFAKYDDPAYVARRLKELDETHPKG